MKRSMVIAAVLAAFTMAGCKPLGPNEATVTEYLHVSTEERIDGDVILTRYQWNEDTVPWLKIGETQTKNNQPVYEITNFEYGAEAVTRNRTIHNADGSTTIQKLETTADDNTEIFKVFVGDNVVEERETRYDYELRPSEITYRENGVVTLHRQLFDYNSFENTGIFSYWESRNGVGPVRMFSINTDPVGNTYEIKADWNEDNTGEVLIEKKSNYSGSKESGSITYKITRYDIDGENPVVTDVTDRYEKRTVTIKY